MRLNRRVPNGTHGGVRGRGYSGPSYSICLDSAVIVVIQICNKFLFEVLHGVELLQIQQLTFEQPKEIFYHSIVQTVSLSTHALQDLRKAGLLETEQRYRKHGGKSSLLYMLKHD